MDKNSLTKKTIFLESFFTDLENEKISYDESTQTITISKKSETYIEYCENIIDLGLNESDIISKAILRRMLKTIKLYYLEFNSDSKITTAVITTF